MQEPVAALPMVTKILYSRREEPSKYSEPLLGEFPGGTVIVSEVTDNTFVPKEQVQQIQGIHTKKGTEKVTPF